MKGTLQVFRDLRGMVLGGVGGLRRLSDKGGALTSVRNRVFVDGRSCCFITDNQTSGLKIKMQLVLRDVCICKFCYSPQIQKTSSNFLIKRHSHDL